MAEGKGNIVFTKAENYKKFYCNGVFGGWGPRGDLVFDFIMDYNDRPQTVPREEEESVVRKATKNIMRESQATAMFTPYHCVSIAAFMLGKVFNLSEKQVMDAIQQAHPDKINSLEFKIDETDNGN